MALRKKTTVVKPLKVKHAAAVARLERDFFPEDRRNGLGKIKGIILNNERFHSDLALGIFNKSSLVGYFLGYPLGFSNTTQSKHEKIVYISDFGVIPAYRFYVKEIQVRIMANALKVFPGRPLIADAFEDYKNKWIKQEAFHRDNGYALIHCKCLINQRFDADVFRIRWEPIGKTLHKVKGKYPFRIKPHVDYYLFQIFRLIKKRLG